MDLPYLMIQTKRLRLRPLRMDDWLVIFTEFTPEITRYMMPAHVSTPQEAKKFLSESIAALNNGTNYRAAVTLASRGDVVGCVSLEDLHTDTPEYGLWIAKAHHGQGYGREAVAGLHTWTQQHVEYRYIRYPVDRHNTPSRRIAEALGGRIEAQASRKSQDGRPLYLLEYRIYPQRPPDDQEQVPDGTTKDATA